MSLGGPGLSGLTRGFGGTGTLGFGSSFSLSLGAGRGKAFVLGGGGLLCGGGAGLASGKSFCGALVSVGLAGSELFFGGGGLLGATEGLCGGSFGGLVVSDGPWPFCCFGRHFGSSFVLLLFGGLLDDVSFCWLASLEFSSGGLDGRSLLRRFVMSSSFLATGSGLAAGAGFGLITGLGFRKGAGLGDSGLSSCKSGLGLVGGCLATCLRLNFFTSLTEMLWPHSKPISLRRKSCLFLSSFFISGGLSGFRGAAFGVTNGAMTPGTGGLGGRGLESSALGLSSNSRLLLMDSLLGGKAGFSSAVGEDGGGGKGPEKWELLLAALGFHSLSLERVERSELDEGSSGRGLDQVCSELVLLLEVSSSFNCSISPGSGAKKLGLEALLVFLYLSMNVTGAQPSLSSI